jgi:hypothetical protein
MQPLIKLQRLQESTPCTQDAVLNIVIAKEFADQHLGCNRLFRGVVQAYDPKEQ